MRHLLIIALLLVACGSGTPHTRASETGENVYYGDSLTYRCEAFVNGLSRAVGGYTSADMLNLVRYYSTIDEPGAIYHIMIGGNDVHGGDTSMLLENVEAAFALLQGEIILTGIPPSRHPDCNAVKPGLNAALEVLTERWGGTYLDPWNELIDSDGLLAEIYTDDGGHFNEAGCAVMFSEEE